MPEVSRGARALEGCGCLRAPNRAAGAVATGDSTCRGRTHRTGAEFRRIDLEREFKAQTSESKRNVLACSPTLEMGIDVGGLDAIVLRNIPPRPDNYAQRGGRAGRRSRVGVVVGYCRSTPHDQYFFDKPGEMIAGEVPTPSLALGNRDVMLRHLNAIAFGAADPGLAGRMDAYVSPMGDIREEAVTTLIDAVSAQFDHAILMAHHVGTDVFMAAEFDEAALRRHLERFQRRSAMSSSEPANK